MIDIIINDITKVKIEAIVNAANTSLLGGGGVDGAIHRKAGKKLLEECRKLNGCKTGEAKITKGYNLECDYIIHTVGPVWIGGNKNEEQLLKNCYLNSLNLAAKNDVKSIAFCAISTGIYRFPIDKATEIAVKTVIEFVKNKDINILFVLFDENIYNKYIEVFEKYNIDFGNNDSKEHFYEII